MNQMEMLILVENAVLEADRDGVIDSIDADMQSVTIVLDDGSAFKITVEAVAA
jgi:hypothetical protein